MPRDLVMAYPTSMNETAILRQRAILILITKIGRRTLRFLLVCVSKLPTGIAVRMKLACLVRYVCTY